MTAKKKPIGKTREIVEALVAASKGSPRWEFPPDALEAIEAVREVNESKHSYISAPALARALKREFAIPVSEKTIAERIKKMHGGRW